MVSLIFSSLFLLYRESNFEMTNLLSVLFLLFFCLSLSLRLSLPAQPIRALLLYEMKCCRMLELQAVANADA